MNQLLRTVFRGKIQRALRTGPLESEHVFQAVTKNSKHVLPEDDFQLLLGELHSEGLLEVIRDQGKKKWKIK
jgi:UDP-N-acetylmuramyl pentapeptide synthase